MVENVINSIRACSDNLSEAILHSVSVDRAARSVEVNIITNKVTTPQDIQSATAALKPFIPDFFTYTVNISKLTPDENMVKRKIMEGLSVYYRGVAATLSESDIEVNKTENGFEFKLSVLPYMASPDMALKISEFLKLNFCGEFTGKIDFSSKKAEDIAVEEKPDEIEFEIPVRYFDITGFGFLEGTKRPAKALYIADLNFAADEIVICGSITDIREYNYTNKAGIEKKRLSITLSDTTATTYVTYFMRKKSEDKIGRLKVGDSIVCTGTNEAYNGNLRFTAKIIDYGAPPKDFVPEKRQTKPVPLYYHCVTPQPYVDMEQTDFLKQSYIPDCLKQNTFVVFDLETTGLNSSPTSGNMDRIIEIGAYKIENGEITQCFSTFINPRRKLSDEIIRLTKITEEMIANAPTFEEVMPDFYKFCAGSILVGHNIAGFDFKFVEYYCAVMGFTLERKIIDTINLSQELLLSLSNYKLNTVADRFNIKFNHHRATDDALATAKIFIELIKLKKSLPSFQ